MNFNLRNLFASLLIGTTVLFSMQVDASAPASAPAAAAAATPAASGSSPSSGSASSSSPSSSSSDSGSSSGGSSGGGKPTYEQFCAAVAGYSKTSAGGNPPKPSMEIYNAFIKNVGSMPIEEQAQFLANSIWETGGLQYMKEIACSNGSCTYGKYYGRGFMQLTWQTNYAAASQAIYKNNSLLDNPDLAAQPDGAWKTAIWYWNTHVKPVVSQNNAAKTYKLGYSIKAINGALECSSGPAPAAKNRLAVYNAILSAFKIASNNPGSLTGCGS